MSEGGIELTGETVPAVSFVVQVIVGTLIFSIVLIAAFGLSKLVSWLEHSGAPPWMTSGAEWVEWGVFWLDVFCYGLFLLSEVLKFIRGLIREWRA